MLSTVNSDGLLRSIMIEVEQIIQNTATHKRRLRDITDGCLRDSRKSTRRNEEPTNNIYD